MRLLGESWRVPHALAALLTAGAAFLAADYVFTRFPVPAWRLGAAVLTVAAIGLNPAVFVFGPVAQAYGMCLFTLTAAFRMAGKGPVRAAACGCLAGTAAASSLLSAAALPVFLGWFLRQGRSRWTTFWGFAAGAALPFLPVMWLFAQGPRQTWFNVMQYHLFYRRLYWPKVAGHNLEVLTAWVDSGPALVTGALAVLGLWFAARRSGWAPERKAEMYLCAWLAAALFAEMSCARPTFERYYLLGVPFLGVLASLGLYAAASLIGEGCRPLYPVLAVGVFLALGLGRGLGDRSEFRTWGQLEEIARKVDEVTPRDAELFAGEPIYFLTRRRPPSGYELSSYTHKIDFPPAKAALLHVVGDAEVKRQIRSGRFATACTCFDSEIEDYGLEDVYGKSAEMHDCTVFWNLKRK